jgi:microsomal dipeptidase-like Zn-dependent dipeptidase
MLRSRLLVASAALCALAPLPAHAVPSRYSLAGGCFAAERGGTPYFFKATRLGGYMVMEPDGALLTVGNVEPGPDSEWLARPLRGGLALRSAAGDGKALVARDGKLVVAGAPAPLRLARARGCRSYPEAELNVRGPAFRTTNRDGTVRGLVDGHFHPVADLRAGGQVISGTAFDPYGITVALGRDHEVHGSDGSQDLTGNLLRGDDPVAPHDIRGWPDFSGWPTYDTNTHQQLYYRWLQRAYRTGLRLAVAQLIEDKQLCDIEPRKSHSCDETETIRLEVARLEALQDYVDAQSGGPGRGWFRLVYDPQQARRVIRQGKLAVVLGVESSSPFGCGQTAGVPQCDEAAVDAGIRLYRQLGIRSMFIAHWIDNAFGGAALEGGDKGTFIATFQLQTGLPFATGACPEEGEGENGECNTKRLTPLGQYLMGKLMDAGMLIEADHLGEWTRRDVLDMAEARGYPLVSSHTDTGGRWVPSQLERLRRIGGYVATTVDEEGAEAIVRKTAAFGKAGFSGIGLGSDTGGFKTLPAPVSDPLRYPFTAWSTRLHVARQRTGRKVYDLHRDGMAHYGLLPDLLADVARRPGGPAALRRLYGGAEAYLRTWERAQRR